MNQLNMFQNKSYYLPFICILLLAFIAISEPCECCSRWSHINFLKSGISEIDSIVKHFDKVHTIPIDSLPIYATLIKERSRDTIEKYLDTALALLHQSSHYDLCNCNSMNRDSFSYIMEILPNGEAVQYNCENKEFIVSLGDIRKISSKKNIFPGISPEVSCLVYLDVVKKGLVISRAEIKKVEFINISRSSLQYGHCYYPIVWTITRSTYLNVPVKRDCNFLLRIGVDDGGEISIIKDDFISKKDSIPYRYIRSQLLSSHFNKIYRPLEIVEMYISFKLKEPGTAK